MPPRRDADQIPPSLFKFSVPPPILPWCLVFPGVLVAFANVEQTVRTLEAIARAYSPNGDSREVEIRGLDGAELLKLVDELSQLDHDWEILEESRYSWREELGDQWVAVYRGRRFEAHSEEDLYSELDTNEIRPDQAAITMLAAPRVIQRL